jgi:hypothetical protein
MFLHGGHFSVFKSGYVKETIALTQNVFWFQTLPAATVLFQFLTFCRCHVTATVARPVPAASSLFAPFHGANAGSNPAGDANSMACRRTVYSLFNKTIGNYGLGEH